jgi:hypothetical protein
MECRLDLRPQCDNPHGSRLTERLERIMPDLPTGTFRFTNIEGSTALRERDRAAMAPPAQRQVIIEAGRTERCWNLHVSPWSGDLVGDDWEHPYESRTWFSPIARRPRR